MSTERIKLGSGVKLAGGLKFGITVAASEFQTPDQIFGSDLWGWWDADDVNTSGSDITQLNDKSGNGNHVSKNGPGDSWTLTSDWNGSGNVAASCANATWYDRASYTQGSNLGQPSLRVAVAYVDSFVGQRVLGSDLSATEQFIIANSAAQEWRIRSGVALGNGEGLDASPAILVAYFNTANSFMRVNGVQVDGGAGDRENSLPRIGGADGGASVTMRDGDVFAFACDVDGSVTQQQIDDLEAYLSDKFGITI